MKPRTELQQLETLVRSWDGVELFELCEYLDYVELCRIRISEDKHGKGLGSAALRLLQDYASRSGVPIYLTPNPDVGKRAALLRFYRRHGFRRATKRQNLKYGNAWGGDWIWIPSKFNVKFAGQPELLSA